MHPTNRRGERRTVEPADTDFQVGSHEEAREHHARTHTGAHYVNGNIREHFPLLFFGMRGMRGGIAVLPKRTERRTDMAGHDEACASTDRPMTNCVTHTHTYIGTHEPPTQ